MKRSKRCRTRALLRMKKFSECRSLSTTYSVKSSNASRPQKLFAKQGFHGKRPLDSKLKHTLIKTPKRVILVRFQNHFNSHETAFKCFEESDMFCFSKGVKNKVKTLTEDFDIESDEETISLAINCQQKNILRTFASS